MDWISVTDRMPELPGDSAERERGVLVIVACAHGPVLAARWTGPPPLGRPPRPPRWEDHDGHRLFSAEVTHWMPLPALPSAREG